MPCPADGRGGDLKRLSEAHHNAVEAIVDDLVSTGRMPQPWLDDYVIEKARYALAIEKAME